MERKRVLLVDDEPEIVNVLRAYLEREGLSVEACGTVAGALALLRGEAPDILVLDVTLPDGSGFDVLRAASTPGNRIPTLMLTARSDEADRVVGLELGADDYVSKPFSPREVLARVGSILRRVGEHAMPSSSKGARRVRIGELEVDYDFHEVRVEGQATPLTATEFKILTVLAENPGEVFSRTHLLDLLGDDGEVFERTLDRHINNLRKKIEKDPRNPEYVLTVYGVGYKMRRS